LALLGPVMARQVAHKARERISSYLRSLPGRWN
jgi:hypothetical protein